ncbi:hypothetical protein BDW59DRAFT_167684 [Aspergillus cavernicola]|uniref:Uncharacterized protein n=1 Tax=Aspergillus cavernicola TaxID=176166 RepID=A0ABR4HBV8_9EURO
MSSNGVFAISSDEVKIAAINAWNEIKDYAISLPAPQKGRAAGFLPTDLCKAAIDVAAREYPEKASYSRKIIRCRKGGVVYFPGQPKVANTLTIMIPIHIQGEVTLNDTRVDMDHHYHILEESTLNIPEAAKLFTLTIDMIIT